MKKKKFALVVPTIRVLNSWGSYAQNFKKYGHDLNYIKIFVVDDYGPYVKQNIQLLKKLGVPFEFHTIDDQKIFFKKRFGKKWQKYWQVIPHRTDACRSFGYLTAAEWGADIIDTWDDDNWAINDKKSPQFDYIGAHSIVGETITVDEATSSNGWLNTCAFLKTEPKKQLYPRGYPYAKHDETYTFKKTKKRIVLNIGLWTGNPDVDAITIMTEGSTNGLPKTKTTALTTHKIFSLAKGTYAPLNTANTAYSRDLLPCIYDTFQGAQVSGLKLDRYGDIWCNLFIKKIVDSVGGTITLGIPLVEHRREPRLTMVDFMKEFWGIVVSQNLFEVVRSVNLKSKNYFDAYADLTSTLSKQSKTIYPDNKPIADYFVTLFDSMNRWLEIIEKLGLK